jgi:NitT/TauT family transport system ATP-binding protein
MRSETRRRGADPAAARSRSPDGAEVGAVDSTPELALEFAHVSKYFGERLTIDDFSLEIEVGRFVTIVGPSGCGKSTLLRLASGLDDATSGDVQLRSRSLGYVFQDATLMPWRTVRANVELLAELEGQSESERRERSNRVIELVGLAGFEDHHPKQLSGGMKMRVSLARSLLLAPDVFLFDEPFGALDHITRNRLNDELLSLFDLLGFTGLFITHSIEEAVYLSTKVVVMSGRPGRSVAEFEIPFSFPRKADLRFDPAFAAISRDVYEALETHS